MADPKDKPDSAPEPMPASPRRFWLYVDKKFLGPYGLRILGRLKNFRADILAAPIGSHKETDWKPASEFPELRELLHERESAKTKAPPPAKPEGKKKRPPLPPLPEGPNYLSWFLVLVLVGAVVVAGLVYRGSRTEAPVAAPPQADPAATPAQMWPDPSAPAERVEAEGKLLQSYFPLLLSVQGLKAEQLAAACASAKEFAAGHESYKAKYGASQLNDFSRRLAVTMRSEARTPRLKEQLRQASGRGVDLSSLQYAKNLGQNLQDADFSLNRALQNAQSLESSFCGKL